MAEAVKQTSISVTFGLDICNLPRLIRLKRESLGLELGPFAKLWQEARMDAIQNETLERFSEIERGFLNHWGLEYLKSLGLFMKMDPFLMELLVVDSLGYSLILKNFLSEKANEEKFIAMIEDFLEQPLLESMNEVSRSKNDD